MRWLMMLAVVGSLPAPPVTGQEPAAPVEIFDLADGTADQDPNYSRLMFAPTGRPLRKGDGYFSDYELLFPGVAYGVTDNFSLAGGVSLIPGYSLSEQLFYVSPRVGFELSEGAAVSVGALYATAGDDDLHGFLIGFGVATLGDRRRSVSLGFGLGKELDGFAEIDSIVMVGGEAVLGRHLAVVGESWLFLRDFDVAEQPFGVALRFFTSRLSADVGFLIIPEYLDEGLPIPWLSVSYHFGRGQEAARATPPPPPFARRN